MSSIYVTGDVHGYITDLEQRIKDNNIELGSTIIVAGDFGFFPNPNNKDDQQSFNKLIQSDYLFCYADGNHEPFDLLYELPTESWCGGTIHRLADNVIHLCRGSVFTIENKRIFVMGGAYSIDKKYRIPGVNWFETEQPSQEEYEYANRYLEKCNYELDYVITHTAPYSLIHALGFSLFREESELDSYLERIKDSASFKKWLFGHYHMDKSLLRGRFTVVHEKMIKLE